MPLGFDTEMSTDFFKGDFNLPALPEPNQNLRWQGRQVSTKECLRVKVPLGVSHQHPPNGHSRVVISRERFVCPYQCLITTDYQRVEGSLKIVVRVSNRRPFRCRTSHLMGLMGRRRLIEYGIGHIYGTPRNALREKHQIRAWASRGLTLTTVLIC